MIIKRGSHTQPEDSKSNIWNVSVPMGGLRGRPLGAYGPNDDSLEIDSWSFEDGVLKVNFGIDPVSGILEYEYQLEGDGNVIVDSMGNQVSITINQYGGGPSTDTFQ